MLIDPEAQLHVRERKVRLRPEDDDLLLALARKLAKLAARRAKPPEPQALGTKDLSGHWWPKLGRMGPRWGVQDTRAGRVA